MIEPLRKLFPSVKIGKILIQRDEETALPKLFYSKFPPSCQNKQCLLLDPMLATGGSAIQAIETLIDYGVSQDKIMYNLLESNFRFVNLISCPEGIEHLTKAFPKITIVTGVVDRTLNEKKYILPGLGDFGCRYFGTDS